MTELNNDPEYRARIEEAECKRRAMREALAEAEVPVVEDLQDVRIEVESA